MVCFSGFFNCLIFPSIITFKRDYGAFGSHKTLTQTTNFYSSFWKTLQL
jgi:hypothetical protein